MRVYPDCTGPMYTWPRVVALPCVENVLTLLQKDWLLALATNAAESEEREFRAIWLNEHNDEVRHGKRYSTIHDFSELPSMLDCMEGEGSKNAIFDDQG